MRQSASTALAQLWVMIGAIALLSGCASLGSRTGGVAVPADLHQLSYWQARGRLGVSGGEGGGSGTFAWEQRKDRADVQIRGPIGIGSVRLQMSGSPSSPRVQLETGDGKVFSADAAWGELEARLGAPVPAGSLRFWMLGLPAPGEHRWASDPSTDAPVLEQDGWRIEYQYTDPYAGDSTARLPARIRASSGAARVRIVIDRWSFDR
jgi:outer membrane lipoprotein LolB